MSELVYVRLRGPATAGEAVYDRHVRSVGAAPKDVRAWASADVITLGHPADCRHLLGLLAAYPGCQVCAAPAADGVVTLAARHTSGRTAAALGCWNQPAAERGSADLASLLYALLVRLPAALAMFGRGALWTPPPDLLVSVRACRLGRSGAHPGGMGAS